VVVSGTDVVRPRGQLSETSFGPTEKLDVEVRARLGRRRLEPRPRADTAFREHVFGVVLVNDWSARDIQAFEYRPLGPGTLGFSQRWKSAVNRIPSPPWVCDHEPVVHTVLIVDDHPSFRSSAHAILEAEGFEVVGEAQDGASALALASRLRPEIVLLDVQLPDMSGFDVCSSLCSGNGSGPAVVLVSSRDADDYGDQIAACGARGFVPKDELSGTAVRALLA
jgi:CheY-like chemotaxis protein